MKNMTYWKSSLPEERLTALREAHQGHYMTGKDLSARLSVSIKSVYRWMQLGQFPRQVKFGRSARWSYADVFAWLEEHEGKLEAQA